MATFGETLAEAERITWEVPEAGWFPPARTTVEALDAAAAAARPAGTANAAWNVLRHLHVGHALWRRWLAGQPADPAEFGAETEWEPVTDASPEAWAALKAAAIAEEAAFRDLISGQPDGWFTEVDPRFGETRLATVVGLIVHTGYHAGELATLASVIGAPG